jgi:hypothetical protein
LSTAPGQPVYSDNEFGIFIWKDEKDIWHIRWNVNRARRKLIWGKITPSTKIIREVRTVNALRQGYHDLLYMNNGDRTFTEVAEFAGIDSYNNNTAAIWGDYDNDGFLDLYIVNLGTASNNAPNRLYKNNGDGTFIDVTGPEQVLGIRPGRGCGSAWGDYDNDGFLDLFVTNGNHSGMSFYKGRNILYRNKGNANNWLKIVPEGVTSNRSGLGVKVTLFANGMMQFREYNGGGGGEYLTQGGGPIHFGLGTSTLVESIIFEWPSGMSQTLNNVGVNQTITVAEESL